VEDAEDFVKKREVEQEKEMEEEEDAIVIRIDNNVVVDVAVMHFD